MRLTQGNIIVAGAIAVVAGVAGMTIQHEVHAGVETSMTAHASVHKQPRLAAAVSVAEYPCAKVVWPYIPAECLSRESENQAQVATVRIASR